LLPANERENVVYIAEDGTVYANKPELKHWEIPQKIGDRTYKLSSGQIITPPQDETCTDSSTQALSNTAITPLSGYPIPCTGTQGPYRRVFSNDGYSWYGGNVYLPSTAKGEVKDNNVAGVNSDTAYIYTGGHGSTGGEIDAGFLHDTTPDDWGFFLRNSAGQYVSNDIRFEAGQTVYIKFYVPQDDQAVIYCEGIKKGTTTKVSYSIIKPATGMKANGSGDVIKRITHIAQPYSDFTTGSYLKNVAWSNSFIGIYSGTNTKWLSAQTGGSCFYPDGNPNVIFTTYFVDYSQETDSIQIHSGP